MTIYYLPIESYPDRYTHQLETWTVSAFEREQGLQFRVVEGKRLDTDHTIQTGRVLDAYGRPYYTLTQTAALIELLRSRRLSPNDVIYMQDMFHPGYEAIPYILSQLRMPWPKIYTHCLAQTVDPADFTFDMRAWMRPFEMMVDKSITGIMVASSCQVDMLKTAMFDAPVHVVGLVFDRDEVRSRVQEVPPLNRRPDQIVYSSRLDPEKNPQFLIEVISRAAHHRRLSGYKFVIVSGSSISQKHPLVYDYLSGQPNVVILENQTKNQYYETVAHSRAHFNCARQDFVSNTLLEASALNTPTLAPAYLSFPETLNNSSRQLFIPWNVEHALDQLDWLTADPPTAAEIAKPSIYHSATMARILEIMRG